MVCVVTWRVWERELVAVAAASEAQGRLVILVSAEGREVWHSQEGEEELETENQPSRKPRLGAAVGHHQNHHYWQRQRREKVLPCQWLEHQASLVEQA